MPRVLHRRVVPHTVGEPSQLTDRAGAKLERCVYSVTSEGREMFIAIDSDGQVIASLRAPNVPEQPEGRGKFDLDALLLGHERFNRAIAKLWIVLEVEDPCNHPTWLYPDFRLA